MADTSVNYWPNSKCAKVFWGQHELPPYQELFAHTVAWLEPRPGERWLDLGCGAGRLSRAIWTAAGGQAAEVVGLDCAGANAEAYNRFRAGLSPEQRDRFHFVAADFSSGLARWPDGRFDGVVSGLAISYAESYSRVDGRWTQAAYDHVLAEVFRVLKSGGRFVFSVNVPEPAWGKVARAALRGVWSSRRPQKYLLKAWRLWRYGGWLKREARRGRFHYLPLPTIAARLTSIGFQSVESRLSFAGQAYLLRGRKAAINTQAA
jgi:ubiquinone/menaquinone biosynthesis C-methylase UbiE